MAGIRTEDHPRSEVGDPQSPEFNVQGFEERRRRLEAAYAPIAADLIEAERIFRAELGSRYPFVQQLVDHSSRFRGKQLRPVLVLLAAKACGGIRPAHAVLAAVVEMIHTATLVHDDILDEARVRRHAATINAEWGNETAVLLGDYLFTHAFHLAASLESTLACRWIGRATNLVCEGELRQVHHRGNLDLDESVYFDIIRGKTAELTAVSCRLGAQYAGASTEAVEALDRFGRHLGIAFQIADDVLDLWGDERTTGKTLGTDLQKQKLTLPLIRLLSASPPEQAETARRLIGDANPDGRTRLLPLLEDTGALQYAWEQAKEYVDRARNDLRILPLSEARDLLDDLAQFVIDRAS
ncbi:polyprenyl synthetase family protein [soil metagenome]